MLLPSNKKLSESFPRAPELKQANCEDGIRSNVSFSRRRRIILIWPEVIITTPSITMLKSRLRHHPLLVALAMHRWFRANLFRSASEGFSSIDQLQFNNMEIGRSVQDQVAMMVIHNNNRNCWILPSSGGCGKYGSWDAERKIKNEIEDESTRLINTAISTNCSGNVVWTPLYAGSRCQDDEALPCQGSGSVQSVCSGLLIIIIYQQSVAPIEVHSAVISSHRRRRRSKSTPTI